MNKRKAGEDFYFLHKIIPLGDFIDITGTCVIPSPRASDRVPFGTGMAIGKYLHSKEEIFYTYSPDCFLALRPFLQSVGRLYKAQPVYITSFFQQLQESLQHYLADIHAVDALKEINANCSSETSFINRFYRWFDAFRIIKFLHYASREYFKQIPVPEAAVDFLEITGYGKKPDPLNSLDLLMILRELERGIKR